MKEGKFGKSCCHALDIPLIWCSNIVNNIISNKTTNKLLPHIGYSVDVVQQHCKQYHQQ